MGFPDLWNTTRSAAASAADSLRDVDICGITAQEVSGWLLLAELVLLALFMALFKIWDICHPSSRSKFAFVVLFAVSAVWEPSLGFWSSVCEWPITMEQGVSLAVAVFAVKMVALGGSLWDYFSALEQEKKEKKDS